MSEKKKRYNRQWAKSEKGLAYRREWDKRTGASTRRNARRSFANIFMLPESHPDVRRAAEESVANPVKLVVPEKRRKKSIRKRYGTGRPKGSKSVNKFGGVHKQCPCKNKMMCRHCWSMAYTHLGNTVKRRIPRDALRSPGTLERAQSIREQIVSMFIWGRRIPKRLTVGHLLQEGERNDPNLRMIVELIVHRYIRRQWHEKRRDVKWLQEARRQLKEIRTWLRHPTRRPEVSRSRHVESNQQKISHIS